MKTFSLGVLALAFMLGWASIATADEDAIYKQIRDQLSKQQFDQAEKLLDQAAKDFPNSTRIGSLHYTMFLVLNRADKPRQAIRHAEKFIDLRLKLIREFPLQATGFASTFDTLTDAYVRAGRIDDALAKLEQTIAEVKKIAAEKNDPRIESLATELLGSKVLLLVEAEREDDAEKLLDQAWATAKAAVDQAPHAVPGVLSLAAMYEVRAKLKQRIGADDARAAEIEHLRFVTDQAKKHSDAFEIVYVAYTANVAANGAWARDDHEAAEKQLARFENLLANLQSDDRNVQSLVTSGSRTIAGLKTRIESAKRQQVLIGTPAFPLEADAFVGGPRVTLDQLAGKVVLLDFFAVWCGPCIATFPHLRRWHDEYADRGLVIIGVTRYYRYDWDDDDKRSQRVEQLSAGDEQKALKKFLKHHELKHRVMITPAGSQMQKNYGVTGIPHVVLIDAEGKIRMVRVGSGEKNAEELEAMIEQLLAENGAA